jgi:hypothetical protein
MILTYTRKICCAVASSWGDLVSALNRRYNGNFFTVNSLKFFTRKGGVGRPQHTVQYIEVSPEHMLATSKYFYYPRETGQLIFYFYDFYTCHEHT